MTPETMIMFLFFIGVMALAFGLYHAISGGRGKREEELETKVTLLQAELEKKELIIEEQKNRNRLLSERVEVLESRVRDLELILYGKSMRGSIDISILNPELLLIASDSYFQRQDEVALNKAKMPYRRIVDATQEKIERELRRARRQKSMFKYIIFSGHSDENGIKMADGTYLDGYWMNQNLLGVEIVLLAGCKTTHVADSMVNIVNNVISMNENISANASQSFSEVFWTNINDHGDVEKAFTEAVAVEPSIRPYIHISTS